MNTTVINTYSLGSGELTWPRVERITDRYGVVTLDKLLHPARISAAQGLIGRLYAQVLQTRQSPHIGDLARGFKPSTPEVGETIMLGEGTLFISTSAGDEGKCTLIGIKPPDNRIQDWLDPQALYRVHMQTVELLFDEYHPLSWFAFKCRFSAIFFKVTLKCWLLLSRMRIYRGKHARIFMWPADNVSACEEIKDAQPRDLDAIVEQIMKMASRDDAGQDRPRQG